MGRPAFKPTDAQRRQVKAMCAYGIPQEDIARVLAVDPKTLRKHFPDELATGSTEANAKVAESLYKKATGDGASAVTAAIFWLKTRAGWKETSIHQMTGADGGPIRTVDESPRERVERRLAGLKVVGGTDTDTEAA